MEIGDHKTFKISDYILDRTKGNEILALVEDRFEDSQLTFALLEMVLLNEKGIGETYIFANKEFDAKKFHQQYIDLVQKFKKEFNGGVSAFKEWYHQDTWIITGEGANQNFYYSVRNYKWLDKFDPREVKHYGEKNGLDRKYITDYLGKYAEEIVDLELKKYPYYFIIVHPIRKHGSTTEISPNGNLYLHFATVKKVNIDQIKLFLNEFMLIWYKLYGGAENQIILQKIADSVLTEDIRKYLPTDMGTHQSKFDYLFAQYFASEDNKTDFHKALEDLVNIFATLNALPYSSSYLQLNQFKEVPCCKDLLKDFNPIDVKNFLLKRSVWLYLFCNKKFSAQQAKVILMKKSDAASDGQSHLSYAYNHLHIYLPNGSKEDGIREYLRNKSTSLSEFERGIIAI